MESRTPGPASTKPTSRLVAGLTPAKELALRRLDDERPLRVGKSPARPAATQLMEKRRPGNRLPRREPVPEALAAEREAVRRADCRRLLAQSGIDELFAGASLENAGEFAADRRLPEEYRALCAALRGLLDTPGQMAICGDRGRGKTWLACAAVRMFCLNGRPAIYRRTRDFFDALSNAEWAAKDAVRSVYIRPELLVLDEVQVRDGDREWQDNELTALVDRRYARNRSTLLLANLRIEALWTNLGASIHRRVIETGDVWETNWGRILPIIEGSV